MALQNDVVNFGPTSGQMFMGSLISAGGGILGGLLGRGKKQKFEMHRLPDYKESEGARKLWWEKGLDSSLCDMFPNRVQT